MMSITETIPVRDGLVLAVIPATRSLLDHSGAGRHPTQAGSGLGWIRLNGVEQLRASGTGRLVVANDATLQAVTDFSVFMAGDCHERGAFNRILNKRQAGGIQIDLYKDSGTDVEIYDGTATRSASIGSWAGVKSFAVNVDSGVLGTLFANGAHKSDFSTAPVITADTADVTLFNYYTGNAPFVDHCKALLWYSRVLSANENSLIHAWSEALTSPFIPADRRYFDMGSLVPDGNDPTYGANILTDGDMEAAGVAAWTPGASADLSKITDSPYEGAQALRIAYDGSNNPHAYQLGFLVGKKYRITGVVRSSGASTPKLYWGGVTLLWTGTTSTDWQKFNFTSVCTHTSLYLFQTLAVAGHSDWDDIRVQEVFETVGAWDLGASAGRQEADKSGNGNHLDLEGACMPVTTELGRALEFDGATGYATTAYDSTLNLGDSGAIAFSVKMQSLPSGTHLLVNYGGQAGYATGYLLAQVGANFFVYWNNGAAAFSVSNTLVVDQWMRFVLNNDSGSLTLYRNGEPVGTGSSSGAITANAATYIGGDAGAWWIDGLMADVVIRNRPMTLSEIKADYKPIRDKVLHYQDFSMVSPTTKTYGAGQVIPGTDYTVQAGSMAVNENASAKWIESVSAGRFFGQQASMHGTYEWSFLKDSGSTQIDWMFISSIPEEEGTSGQYAYFVRVDAAERLVLKKSVNGVLTDLVFTATGYVSFDTRYNVRVTRDLDGEMTAYIKGGVFTEWTPWTAAGGSNPVTDTSISTSSLSTTILDLGDRMYLEKLQHGEVAP
jgi:hypothetical protein